ncbi:hypothetical protein GCM10023170_067730 [Phytohabitans houttuyneae]|uniref:Uncharacterized protein n=1 Tax=Phytohabitans houttuyneae TaxID=1076126 RepID=A0A6V8K1C3_9ACTN|nr:hypothetical protein Phou_016740 [Phytohabitans houttuyneae]
MVDAFAVVVFLLFAGRARREALYADADRIVEQLRIVWGPLAAKSLAAGHPDPTVRERSLQQMLATPRPAPSRSSSPRRCSRPATAPAGGKDGTR